MSRTHRLVLAALLAITMILFSLGTAQRPPMEPPEQQAVINAYRNGLAELAKGSPLAAEALARFDLNAVRVVKNADGGFEPIDQRNGERWFLVVVTEQTPDPDTSADRASTNCDSRAIVLRQSTLKPLALGLIFGHELHHMEDCLDGKMPIGLAPEAPRTDAEVLSERDAYQFGHDVLDQWSHGAWSRLVSDSQQRTRAWLTSVGQPYSFDLGTPPEDIPAIKAIVGDDLDEEMLDVFETQLIIDKNLRNVHVIAQEQRLDPTVEPNGQLLFFRAYYGDLRATH